MKKLLENWNKFVNEAKTGMIDTVRGEEEVNISYELGNFFIYKNPKSKKVIYMVTHKPSGKRIPHKYYVDKYGDKLAGLKKMLADIDSEFEGGDLGSQSPSEDVLRALIDFLSPEEQQELSEASGAQEAFDDLADAAKKLADAREEEKREEEEEKEKEKEKREKENSRKATDMEIEAQAASKG